MLKTIQSFQKINQMVKADFYYTVRDNIISIVDEDKGNMSVTNDIENVVAYIADAENINPEDYLIVYRDSDRIWDGWNAKEGRLVALRKIDYDQAVAQYKGLSNPKINL